MNLDQILIMVLPRYARYTQPNEKCWKNCLPIFPKAKVPSEFGEIFQKVQGFFLGVLAKTQFVQNAKTQFENTKTQFENDKTQFEN